MTARLLTVALAAAIATGCAAEPPSAVVQLTPVEGPLGVSAQAVFWAGPAPDAPTPGDVRSTTTTTARIGLEGRSTRAGDLVLLAEDAVADGSGLWLVPDRFDGPPSGERSVPGPGSCPGGLASRWEVTSVVDAVADLRLLDVVLLCGT